MGFLDGDIDTVGEFVKTGGQKPHDLGQDLAMIPSKSLQYVSLLKSSCRLFFAIQLHERLSPMAISSNVKLLSSAHVSAFRHVGQVRAHWYFTSGRSQYFSIIISSCEGDPKLSHEQCLSPYLVGKVCVELSTQVNDGLADGFGVG